MQSFILPVIATCHKSITSFWLLGNRSSAAKCALLSLLTFLLMPTHPFRGKDGHWLELVDRVEGREINRKMGIYSVLKLHGENIKEDSVWAITESIHEESEKYSLDPMLILAVITVESRFQHTAVSAKGARGLMQIRPLVAAALAKEIELARWDGIESLNDPVLNIRIGAFYLSRLQQRFKDLKLALAAYNWGPTEIQRRLKTGEPVPSRYVTRVLAVYERYRQNRAIAETIKRD